MNYNGKKFGVNNNSENGETTADTIFHYIQEGNILTSNYSGGQIVKGHLIAKVAADGSLDMRYHQINMKGELTTGICLSIPEILPNGKIRLHEKWQWTSGDKSSGESILEEV
jgi:hypothetical protein